MYQPHVAILVIDLRIPSVQSLKEKRSVILSWRDRLQSKFNISIAEIGEQDSWQRSVFGISMISGDKVFLDQAIQKILELAGTINGAEIVNHQLEYL